MIDQRDERFWRGSRRRWQFTRSSGTVVGAPAVESSFKLVEEGLVGDVAEGHVEEPTGRQVGYPRPDRID